MATTSLVSDLTDEQRAICEMVHQFADEQILPNAEHYDHEDAFPEPIVERSRSSVSSGSPFPRSTGEWGWTSRPTR